MRVSFDWRSFISTWYWVISVVAILIPNVTQCVQSWKRSRISKMMRTMREVELSCLVLVYWPDHGYVRKRREMDGEEMKKRIESESQ